MNMAFDGLEDASDDALMVLYANGDSVAAQVLTARHAGRVLALANRMLKDSAEAEDVTQEAMLRLWKNASDWRQGEAKVSTWLYKVASNLCLDRLRKTKGTDLDAIPELEDDSPGVEATMMAAERAKTLNEALAQLPERQRMAISLRHIEGLSNPEIAEAMELSVEAVESLTARGKRSLKALLSGMQEKLGLV